ncbi:MAG: hypothetical protein U0990_04640 [Candidatus Nanopelagicales bacterium]|nr:hypothetical protein [Candidatus Nanopelagicales bacterium]MDZ4249360.1 hypothetical protein [Candidatus Nanopelagicales bacterium]
MSTAATQVAEPTGAPKDGKPRHYGSSALFSGAARMWRAWLPCVVVIVVNAAIQGLMVIRDPAVTASASFIAAVVISLVCILATYAVITASALGAVEGKVGFGEAFKSSGRHLGLFVAWVLGLMVVSLAAYMVYVYPGFIVLAITPYVAVAAMAGRGNALAANFRAIAGRPGRTLLTVILIGVMLFIVSLLAAANYFFTWFFVRGFASSLVAWIAYGLLAWWWTTSLACVYRSTAVGDETV